ncbi:MAG: hypothetical protein KME42_09890 [Tildeniella nuda ZEHNDER 1965/U140]|jgi:hypothetical protein|nr:hypothetical protein [Tildeniella nuda ZEHNDER 1965/U140]
MTELVNHSTERSNDSAADAVSLLHHYGFDLGGYAIAQLLLAWQEQYPAAWLRLAIIEALYQGRYKAISVEQILALWQRRSQPLYHFNHEFERLVCDHLPASLLPLSPAPRSGIASQAATLETKLPYHTVALQLPSFEEPVLPEADVMLALRTLHSKELAALADAQKHAQTEQQSSMQYSYTLRSDEPSKPLTEPHSEASVQSNANPAILPDADATPEAIDEAMPEPIALTAEPSEPEQLTEIEPLTDEAPPVALPASEVEAPTAQTESIARILQQLDHQAVDAKIAPPGFGLMAHTLKPKLQLHLTARYQPIWLTEAASKQPIHQFTPEQPSDFHSKLKAVVQPEKDSEEETSPPGT